MITTLPVAFNVLFLAMIRNKYSLSLKGFEGDGAAHG
jgi:hypothetical protein